MRILTFLNGTTCKSKVKFFIALLKIYEIVESHSTHKYFEATGRFFKEPKAIATSTLNIDTLENEI